MKLDGFAVSGYRSFGPEMVYVPDLSKINVFVGRNNAGKSNILRFCSRMGQFKQGRFESAFDPSIDCCLTVPKKTIDVAIQVRKDSPATGKIFNQLQEMFPHVVDYLRGEGDSIWLEYRAYSEVDGQSPGARIARMAEAFKKSYNSSQTDHLASRYCGYTGGSPDKRVLDLAERAHRALILDFKVFTVEAFRQISGAEEASTLNGHGLIQELRRHQSPRLSDYAVAKENFRKVQDFLRELTGEPDATLEIPAEADEIYVTMHNKVLPLHSLGTGIHELIILAAAVTLRDNAVFCIEEPEIHLHPGLQKRFVQFLAEKTDNQYLISTHSNAFFDLPGVNVYHCWQQDGYTCCNLVSSDRAKHGILADLGYKPSDLLQANFVVWVEGPSDRLYLREWIRKKDASLIEGVHYIIMFYGGRLLSHLAFESPEVQEFIQLSRLNRSAAILMDSDRTYTGAKLGATKRRVRLDFEAAGGFTWVTKGRTIENYMEEDAWNRALYDVHPRIKKQFKWSQFGDLTRISKTTTVDKIRMARRLAAETEMPFVLDLDKQITKLIERIRLANQ